MLPQKNPNTRKWLALINMPIQMGVTIYGFSWVGTWLDTTYKLNNTIGVKVMVLIGVAIAFYNLNRQLKKINETPEG
ncbi:AtpZ/AtpI family protein [Flavobacterium branchiophilum]|uniref:Putative F0F1-ATPase subunit (Ca2+/Mg2+ transporter) n=1 Tax=Flavobacterium branchiophilum TaxID=55197 RepID=A0A543G3N5_9FLAO|nr:AtpZ/AtpI family protein [Flavobacterium branchiophilum]TQM40634.1 putative F0F1-ATPase subunit (Ca2+/Mg2+ transporter) [Flavobacterium branchiophilum]